MSWKDAKAEAAAWLQQLDLPQELAGREIDLATLSANLPQTGQFRKMIVRAAARQLKARGAKIKQ